MLKEKKKNIDEIEKLKEERQYIDKQKDLEDEKVDSQAANTVIGHNKVKLGHRQDKTNQERNEIEKRKITASKKGA